MSNYFIPDSVDNRLAWFTNLKATVNANAATLGWSAAKLSAFNALIDPIIASYQLATDTDLAARTATGNAQNRFENDGPALVGIINEIKTNPAFTDGMGAAMSIFTSNGKPGPADIQPTLTAEPERGHVRITGSKNYAETVNIYLRRKAGPVGTWTLIAPKRKRFPFEDQTALLVAGVPEEREYMARGVIGDNEIGQDSTIITVVFGG